MDVGPAGYKDEHVALYRIRHVGNGMVKEGDASTGMQEGNWEINGLVI